MKIFNSCRLSMRLLIFCILSSQTLQAQGASSTPEAVQAGAVLYDSLRCGICHNVRASGINVPPSLVYAGDKYEVAWLESYLKAPYRRRWQSTGVRPILRMPDFQLSDEEAQSLTAYLTTKQDSTRFKPLVFEADESKPEKIAEGKEIFNEYACYGCHVIDGEGGKVGPDLTHVGSRLQAQYLAVFLKDPQALIPGSPMKSFDFWEEELEALVAYMISLE